MFKTLLHAAIGGFGTGFAGRWLGANYKVAIGAGVVGAVASVLSLFAESPTSTR